MNKTPWWFVKAGDNNVIVDANGRPFICDTNYYPWVDLSPSEWRLVAAAPELLEALEDLLTTKPFAWDKARAAIAKARGLQ